MSYGNEEFEIILQEIKKKLTIKEIAQKHYMSEKTVRKLLYGNGYKYDKKQELWYSPSQKRAIDIMNNCDIEVEIDELSNCRYYDRYVDPYPCEEEQEQEQIDIHKGIYEEISELAEEYGCSYPEELIELILLRFLDTNRKKDLTTIFRKKYFLEHGYDEKEVNILMNYNDEDNISATTDELFWEDDEAEEVKELKEFYKRELEKNNINVSDINEFADLNEKYNQMTGNKYWEDYHWKCMEDYLNRVRKCGGEYSSEDLKLLEELNEYKKKKGDKCE